MGLTTKSWIAGCLAILTLCFTMSVDALANQPDLNVPQKSTDPISLTLTDNERDTVRSGGAAVLQVFVGKAETCCDGRTPMAGKYTLKNITLSFTPAFGFEQGQDYLAKIENLEIGPTLVAFRISPTHDAKAASVVQIFPSGDALPENVLRFYIHFSTPMAPGAAFDHIKLRDASGQADEAAFMRFKQELWNEDRTRLTVLFDPGRIKREVATNRALGPALLEGGDYTLEIEDGWASADGATVLPKFTKQISVVAPLRELPDLAQWTINAPCGGSREPLRVQFDRPFDRHLLTKDLHVADNTGRRIAGDIQVGKDERSWSFIPRQAWNGGAVELIVSADLEGVAGNNFRDLLDHVGTEATKPLSEVRQPVQLSMCSQ